MSLVWGPSILITVHAGYSDRYIINIRDRSVYYFVWLPVISYAKSSVIGFSMKIFIHLIKTIEMYKYFGLESMFDLFIWPKIWKIILNSEFFHGTYLAAVNYSSPSQK